MKRIWTKGYAEWCERDRRFELLVWMGIGVAIGVTIMSFFI